jgi:hypothetical protein
MTGYLDIHGARQFLGNRSLSWLRSHIAEIPHLKLYDRLLFDPAELRVWVERTAERHNPVDVDAVVAQVMQPKRKGRAAR